MQESASAFGEQVTFDLAYSAVRSFASLSADAQAHTCTLMASAVQQAAKACKRALSGCESDTTLAQARATLKAAVYLQVWLVQEAEKVAAKAALASRRGAAVTSTWDDHREKGALCLLEALELPLKELWEHRPMDEAFIVLFSRAANAILEHPAALKAQDKTSLREALWRLIGLPAVKYGQQEATIAALVKLLLGCEHEHGATHLAELMQRLLDEHEAILLVANFLRELTTLPASEMGADAAGPKNVASFLHALAVRAPLMLVANLELLLPHLGSDSYALRCGAVSAHGQLLIQVSQLGGAQPPEVQEAVKGLLDVPLKRLNDSSSFVRCRSLQTLCLLAESRALPIERFAEVATVGLQRLNDKNANVRKGALQLFSALVEFNPLKRIDFSRAKLEERRDEVQKLVTAAKEEAGEAPPTDVTDGGAAAAEEAAGAETASAAEGTESAQEGDAGGDAAAAPAAAPRTEAEIALDVIKVELEVEAVLRARLDDVVKLLGSSTTNDVIQAMQAVVTAHSFNVEGARPAAVLTLVWSKESTVKTWALSAAQSVWLNVSAAKGPRSLKEAVETSRALLDLVEGANLAELTSLEEVMKEWQQQELLPASLINILWDVLQGNRPELAGVARQRAALALLNMAAQGDAQLLRCKLDLLLRCIQTASSDLVLARHACIALQCIAASGAPIAPKAARSATKALEKLLGGEPSAEQAELWFPAAEQAINTIFALSDAPEELMTAMLHKMGGAVAANDDADGDICSGALSRLLFCVGHVAMKTLVHIEACDKMLQRQRAAQAENGGAPSAASASSKGAKGKKGKKGADKKEAAAEEEEDDLAAAAGGGAAAAEADTEYLAALGEKLVAPGTLLGAWAPLVSAVCLNADNLYGAELRGAAALTMCKLMCVSSKYCEDHLQELFTVLRVEAAQGIRANIAIALGDLAVRHPNVLEPWTAHLYAQLRDGEPRVRKNVLMVLTHLILNDMVKVKGQISELALCLLDQDERIASLARLFFTEFAKKSSAPVYNLLPDIVSSLTNASLAPEEFREVLGFLIAFVGKDRQAESMVQKLCDRFDMSDAPRVHQDIAFCIGALSHTERSVLKLLEMQKSFVNKLGDDEVRACFVGLAKTRKAPGTKPELRKALDDLAALVEQTAQDAEEAEAAAPEQAAASAVVDEEAPASVDEPAADAPASKPLQRSRSTAAAPKKAASSSRRGRAKKEEEEADDVDEEDGENAVPKASSRAKAAPKAASKAKAAAVVDDAKAAPAPTRSRRTRA